jgi:periplasmic divalent cation tolerance protein
MSEHVVVMVAASSQEEARRVGRVLLEKKLAACVQFFPMTSLFYWEGELQEAAETMMMIKTTASVFEKLREEVKAAHSYQVPEIIELPIQNGSAEYLRWVSHEVQP